MRFVIVFIHTVVCYGMCTIFCEGLMQVVSCKHFFIIVVFPPPCTLSTRKNNCFFFFCCYNAIPAFFSFLFPHLMWRAQYKVQRQPWTFCVNGGVKRNERIGDGTPITSCDIVSRNWRFFARMHSDFFFYVWKKNGLWTLTQAEVTFEAQSCCHRWRRRRAACSGLTLIFNTTLFFLLFFFFLIHDNGRVDSSLILTQKQNGEFLCACVPAF